MKSTLQKIVLGIGNLHVTTKLMASFGIMVALTTLISFEGLRSAATLDKSLKTLFNEDLAGISAIKEAAIFQVKCTRVLRDLALASGDKEAVTDEKEVLTELEASVDEWLSSAQHSFSDSKSQTKTREIQAKIPELRSLSDKVAALALAGDQKGAMAALKETNKLSNGINLTIAEICRLREEAAKASGEECERAYHLSQITTAICIILSVSFAALLCLFTVRMIARPLMRVTRATSALVDDKFEPLPIPSGDEIGVLTSSFNRMMLERQEDRNNLEARVLARTDDFLRANKQLAANQRDMRLILDNLQEGLVTINLNGQISGETSHAIREWFGAPAAGTKLAAWIGSNDTAFGEWLELGLETVRDGFLPLEVALSQLPARLKNNGRTYAVEYQTITDAADDGGTASTNPIQAGATVLPEKILVIISDMTEALNREALERYQADLMQAFQHMMRDKTGFLEFLKEADGIVELLQTGRYENLDHLKRLLHTLKGNSAIFGVRCVSGICHTLEDGIAERNEAPPESQIARLEQAWNKIRSDIAALMGEARAKHIEIDDAEFDAILDALRTSVDVRTLARMLESWRLEPTGKRLERVEQQIKGIAERMGKSNIKVSLESNDLRFNSERFAPFWAAFIHVLRNTVDHGVESAEERQRSGKPQESHIKIATAVRGERFLVTIEDDGPGVDWERLRTKAAQLGMAESAKMAAVDLLCIPGLSSKDSVTELSGRGVGMSALADVCLPLRGKIEVESERKIGTRITFAFPKNDDVYEGHAALLQASEVLDS